MFQPLHFRAVMFLLCFWALKANAQGIKDPTHWEYAAVKLNDGNYQIRISLKLDKTWHIWSTEPQGDGMQIAPSFHLDMPTSAEQKFIEAGKKHVESMEGIDKPVAFYSDSVTYVTNNIKATPGKIIKGEHSYQVCNDMICLPPTTKQFSIRLP